MLSRLSQRAEQAIADGDRLRDEWKRDSLRLTIRKYAEARTYFHRTRSFREEAQALKRLGDVSCLLSEYRVALNYYAEAIRLARNVSDRQLEVDLLNQTSNAYLEMANVTLALRNSTRAAEMSRQIGYRRGTGEALNQLGIASSISSDMLRTEEYLNQALTSWHQEDYAPGRGATWLNLGYLYSNLGDMEQALESYRKALTIWQQLNDQLGQALTFTAMGGVYALQGEKQRAFSLHNKALKLFQRIGNRNGEAATLNGIGYLYDELGDGIKALNRYTLALGLYRSVENLNYAAITSGYIGRIHLARGETDKALKFFNDKLTTSRAVQDRRMEAYTLKDIGNVLSATKKGEALGYYTQALRLSHVVFDRRGEAHLLNSIGSLYADWGKETEARNNYLLALPLMRAAGDRRGEISTLYRLALTERELGQLTAARGLIEESIALIESLRTKLVNPSLRVSYLDTVYQHYEFYVDLLMRMDHQDPSAGYKTLALEVNEYSRAKTLLENLIVARTNIYQGLDSELLAQATLIRQQLNKKASQQLRLLSGRSTPERAASITQEVETLLAQYEEVEARVREGSQKYRALTQPRRLSLADIQRELDENTLLLEYSLGADRSYGWAVTATSVITFELPKRAEIEELARRSYQLLAASNAREKNESPADQKARFAKTVAAYPVAAARLTKILLEPIQSHLGNKRLVIVADGVLQYIPFAALPEPGQTGLGANSWQPLVVKHEVATLPSLSTLAVLRAEMMGRAQAEKTVAIFADPVFEIDDPRVKPVAKKGGDKLPSNTSALLRQRGLEEMLQLSDPGVRFQRLPFSRLEAEAILSVVPTRETKLVLGFNANVKTALDRELRRYRIIHFATHGLLDTAHPDLSAVVLSLVDSSGQAQDGFLRLNEIYNLDLAAELVVLSACQTALGKESRAEGLIGLTRGFMYAGAPRVIASLWRIDDRAAAELMSYFYEAMFRQHLPPAAALRVAQVRMWQTSEWRFPYYWGAFVLQGEWN